MFPTDYCGLRSAASVRSRDYMHPQYEALFTTIDKYVRARHHCFVAELSHSQTKWVLCIRPTEENIRALSLDVYACKYFSLSLEEVDDICAAANALGPKLAEKIDHELHSIRDLDA
jgi:hypothetical protein